MLLFPLVAPVLLSACVSQSKYDQLQAQYQQVQQQNAALSNQVAADKAQICRLQGAIKYTVNSDLLFRPGGAVDQNIKGTTYFVFGGAYYRPFYSGSSVIYEVVAKPA